jgi:hypothetical protein
VLLFFELVCIIFCVMVRTFPGKLLAVNTAAYPTWQAFMDDLAFQVCPGDCCVMAVSTMNDSDSCGLGVFFLKMGFFQIGVIYNLESCEPLSDMSQLRYTVVCVLLSATFQSLTAV